MNWFQTVFTIFNYPISLLECISVTAGITAVFFAAKEKIITWPIGLINIITAFFIYYSVQLYSDMFLQCYFFGISIYGWIYWSKEKKENIPLKWLSNKERMYCLLIITVFTFLLGIFISRIHLIWPKSFVLPAAYPWADSLIAISSIVANTLMARRIIENWILWILVDIICVYIYIQKDILFISFEFFVFLLLASFGLFKWIQLKNKQELQIL